MAKIDLKSIYLRVLAYRSSDSLIAYYRRVGMRIGENCVFRSPSTTRVDTTRPCLISIGNNVDMNANFTIMSHDFTHHIFVDLYGEFLSSSGGVNIGSNIYFGTNVTVLKGVTIGDNCIIGAGSIVTKDIPSNSVAVGTPCKVVCSIEEYYMRRQSDYITEACRYANAIRERLHREPVMNDFKPEFGIYTDSHNIAALGENVAKSRLKHQYDFWLKNHKAPFNSFEEFLKYSKTIK